MSVPLSKYADWKPAPDLSKSSKNQSKGSRRSSRGPTAPSATSTAVPIRCNEVYVFKKKKKLNHSEASTSVQKMLYIIFCPIKLKNKGSVPELEKFGPQKCNHEFFL